MLEVSNILKIVVFKMFVNLILLKSLNKISKGLYYIAVIVILILVMNSKRLNKLYPLLFCDNLSDVSLYDESTNSGFFNIFFSSINQKNSESSELDKKDEIEELYLKKNKKQDFILNINHTNSSIPLFNLRTFGDLGFHYNFVFYNFDPDKINNLIMAKDINKWMTKPALSEQDLPDDFTPIFFIKKENNSIKVSEYLKLFIKTDNLKVKSAFIQKGDDYDKIKEYIDIIIQYKLVKDLLNGNEFNSYNLSTITGLNFFLDRLLSYVLPSESLIGDKLLIDIENYNDNKKTFNYFFNNVNSDLPCFTSTI